MPQKQKPELEDIANAIAAVFNVAASDIKATGSSNKFGVPRAAFIYIASDLGFRNADLDSYIGYKHTSSTPRTSSRAAKWTSDATNNFSKKLQNVRGWLQRNGFDTSPTTNQDFYHS